MRYVVDRRFRHERMDLAPGGATVAVETLADNPFEDERGIEVFTQATEGMAGPDRAMTTAGVRGRRPGKPVRGASAAAAGAVPAVRFRADAVTGFMPGMGGFLGDLGTTVPAPIIGVPGVPQTPTGSSSGFVNALSEGLKTGANVLTTVRTSKDNTRIADAQARAAEAAANRAAAEAVAESERTRATGFMAAMSQNKGLTTAAILGVTAVAVAAFLLLRKRSK